MATHSRARADFRAFLLVQRAEHPLPVELPGAERMIGEILADVFTDWLGANAARFAPPPKRGFLSAAPPAPRFLYETDAAGLTVLREREVEVPDALTLVTVDELQEWRDDHPQTMDDLYPIISSFFTTSLPTALYQRALARNPLRPNEDFLIHVRAVWTSPTSGHGGDDLWKTDGNRLTLLAPRFSRWKT